nr:MAG TPA: REGULATOR OF NONSENSE TRANSCRIPTS 1 MEDIATED DECAY, ZINC-FINGER, ATP-BINDING [Caudoviricetes sp.]
MVKNDWIVAGLSNPQFTNKDFKNIAGMTVDNTQLLNSDEYLKYDFIKNNPEFRDKNGNFSKDKFTDYYKKRVKDFGEFQEQEIPRGPALDMFDIDRTKTTPVKNIRFDIRRGINPNRQAIGIEGVNVWSEPTLSRREIAKQNKVFNTASGKYEDYTVNDHTLVSNPIEWFKDLFRDPLVLATYDSDGVHIDPITGIEQKHKKGDAKLNDKGTYYYETLGNRSIIDKDVLSVFDTFTVDGQGINKYDFFDSNDIEKSTSGVITKSVAAVLPLFCGPVVGGIYSAVLIGKEFSKAMPMLYGMVSAFTESKTPTWVNDIAAYGTKFSSSSSDYGKDNAFSFESFGSLVADVATQWGQQKTIAQGFNKLRNSSNYIKEAEQNAKALYDVKKATLGESTELWQTCLNRFLPEAEKKTELAGRLGRNMSLAYMAIISNSDVYSDALAHGTTKKEAAAIAFGSTLGMFTFDKYSKLGEIFFDDATGNATKAARRALRNEFAQARGIFDSIKASEAPSRNKFLQYIKTSANIGKRAISKFNDDLKYHSLSLTGKMLGEGLEEVGEELISDTSKSLYELAGEFGFDTSTKDVGSWDNAFERYAMNFLGGAVGGGVFYGKEVWDKGSFHKPKLDEDIATLIRNGHVDELRQQLAVMNKEGKTGDKNLSSINYELTDNNKVVWKTTNDETTSQSQAVMSLVNDRINSIEEVLIGNRANLSDDELFDNMVLSEKRYNKFKNIFQITNYYQDFANVLNKVVNNELSYKHASDTMEGTPNGTKIPNDTAIAHLTEEQKNQRQANIDSLKQNLDISRGKLKEFLAGENSLDYTRKLNFAVDPILHSPFLEIDMTAYLQTLYPGKTLDQLTPEEATKFVTQQWPEYVQTQLKTKLTDAWNKFKDLESKVNPHLNVLSENVTEYKKWANDIISLINTEESELNNTLTKFLGFNDKLDSETDEEYKNRDTKIINPNTGQLETQEEFNQRKFGRYKAIIAHNEAVEKQWVDNIDAELKKVNYKVDPQTLRHIKKLFSDSGRLRTIINRKIAVENYTPTVSDVLKLLKTDLSNTNEVTDTLNNAIEEKAKADIDKKLSALVNMKVTDINGKVYNLNDFLNENADLGSVFLGDIEQEFDNFRTDPNSVPALNKLNEQSRKELESAVNDLIALDVVDEYTTTLSNITSEETSIYDIDTDTYAEDTYGNAQYIVNHIISEINKNAVFQLQTKLKTSIVNPIGELIKQIAASNNDIVYDVDSILETIQDDYDNIDDIYQLQLNDAQRENLTKVRNYMELLKVYLYAASTTPSTNNPIGHNRTINEFAESHKDKLLSPWEKLPEISSDYVALYLQTIGKYNNEIDYWINLSDSNSINKIAKFTRTDKALCTTLWNILSKLPRTFTFRGKTLDILSRIESIDTILLDSPSALVPLYNLERLVYKNIHQFAYDNGISVVELVKNSNLLETLVPGITDLKNQQSSVISDTLTDGDYTDFDKLQYIITILASDPTKFYKDLNQRVNSNKQIAPIISQELSDRIAQSSMLQPFRDMFTYAKSLIHDIESPMLPNTTIIFGIAGSGKTHVVLSAVDSAIKNEEVFVVGPTTEQASVLQSTLNRNKSFTFEDLLYTILGKEQWIKIKTEYDNFNSTGPFDGTYFSTSEGKDELLKLKLKTSAIQFNNVAKPPKAIYIDEATHLSTLQAEIISEYAHSVGAQVFMCGDSSQLGYNNSTNGVQNIDEGAVFAVRTPKLTISLRDNNLQKFQNQEAVKSTLDSVLEARLYKTEKEYAALFPIIKNLMSKFNFRIYEETELNGDMIIPQLDDATIAKLKGGVESGKTIAFIGDASSAQLAKLQSAGINIPNNHIFSLAAMQGQEFDYVVIDENFKAPTEISQARIFLQKLYTLMTRAREASITIDNGLSSIIGKNVISNSKSKAPSIRDGVDKLIKQKLDVLSQLDYTPITIEGSTEPSTDNKLAPTNSEEDFNDPDNIAIGIEAIKAVTELSNEDIIQTDDTPALNIESKNDLENFPIECYGDVTYLSVDTEENVKMRAKNSRIVEATKWKVPVINDGELRNLQALLTDNERQKGGVEVFWYKDKIALQRRLYELKSAILFQHQWPTAVNPKSLPNTIVQNFNQDDWENGTYELEFRNPTSQDIVPVHGNLTESGFEYNGQRLIANIIFKVKDKRGRICKFDIAGINNPKTLINSKEALKNSLTSAINSPKTNDATRQKLQKMLASVDNVANFYKTWFDDRVLEFNKNGYLSIDVSTAIKHTNTTWFKKRKGNPIRLGGTINPENVNESNVNSLIYQNPDKVFSPIYTFSDNEADFYNIDPSLKGKAVIFVTDDILMEPSELVSTYLAQKRNPDNNTPKVRMLVLGNYGMTFSQLINSDYIESFQQKVGKRKPFRQNFNGLRMFTSLWNTRVALIKFTNALNTWASDNNLNSTQIETLMKAQHMQYTGEPDAKILQVLTDAGLNEKQLSLIDEFNNTICKDIPMFRLGYNTNGNGFHIQQYDVKDSIAYNNKDKVNLCAITPQKATQFLEMLRVVMQPICPSTKYGNLNALNSLNVKLTKVDNAGNTVEWGEDEFIDFKQASHRRTLSGLLRSEESTIKIEYTNPGGTTQTLAYMNNEAWSMIPSVLSHIANTVTYHQYHTEQNANGETVVARVHYSKDTSHDNSDKESSLEIDLTAFFGQNGLLQSADNTGVIDHSLFDMFNLIFHGSTDKLQQSMQLEDAYFKKGFFINPNISRKADGVDATDIVGYKGHNGKLIFFEIETNPALFTVDVDLRASGLQLDLNALINPTTNNSVEQTTTTSLNIEQEFKNNHPVIADIIDNLNQIGRTDSSGLEFTYNENDINEAVELFNQIQLDGFKSVLLVGTSEQILNYIYTVNANEEKLSYKQYLLQQYPEADISIEGNDITLLTKDGKLYKLDKQNAELVLISDATPTTESLSRLDEKYQNSTVGQVLLETLNTPEFINLAKECGATDEILSSFMQEMNSAIQLGQTLTNSEDPLTERLNSIMNTDGNETVLEALMTTNEELYQIIFENC